MSLWLAATQAAAAANLVLLAALGGVWLRNYRRHGASHTLGLLVVAGFLLVENALWLYFYTLHSGFIGWLVNAGVGVQAGVLALCGLELLALVALVRITWL
ncbi:MAG: hypothetical protein ABEH77_09310 [Halobacteriaceae archaeon]